MPAKGKGRVSASQRAKIALGRATGKTSRVIAGEAGLATRTVERQVVDSRTVSLVLGLKHRHEDQLARIYAKALDSIERDLDSEDALVRLAAVRDALRYITAGDPPLVRISTEPEVPENSFTLEELLISYRQATQGKPL